ncbi:MAG: hypothetical protein WBC91_25725 [Phototrophicaceae bacterium]
MRKFFLVCLLIMTSVFTTGCIKSVMRFNPDGSGTLEIGFNLSVQALEEAGDVSEGEVELDEFASVMLNDEEIIDDKTGIGLSAEERLENGSIWSYIIFSIPDAESWQYIDIASERLLPESDEDDNDPTSPDNLAQIPTITVTDSSIRVEFTVPSTVDPDERPEDDPFGMAAIMGAFVQLSYEIEMPGTLIEHNGQIDTLTGNPVWIVDLTSTDDIEIIVESERE